MDELLDEDVFGKGCRLALFEQVLDGGGDEAWTAEQERVIAHGVEAMLEGVGGGLNV